MTPDQAQMLARMAEILEALDIRTGGPDGALKQAADLTVATQARVAQIAEALDERTGNSDTGTLKRAADVILRKVNPTDWPDGSPMYIAAQGDIDNINAHVNGVAAATLNQQFTLPDGTVTNLAGILAAINAKPVGVSNAPAAVDVDALVARLKAELPAAVLAELTNKLTK